jgi:hypothetical protein
MFALRPVLQPILLMILLINVYYVISIVLTWLSKCTYPPLAILNYISIWSTHMISTSIHSIGKLSKAYQLLIAT